MGAACGEVREDNESGFHEEGGERRFVLIAGHAATSLDGGLVRVRRNGNSCGKGLDAECQRRGDGIASKSTSKRKHRVYMNEQQTIQSVIQGLGDDLRAYLEAQYHVRDESVLHERKLLLHDGATIAQQPFLEATPAYVLADEYAQLDLPTAAKSLFCALAAIPITATTEQADQASRSLFCVA